MRLVDLLGKQNGWRPKNYEGLLSKATKMKRQMILRSLFDLAHEYVFQQQLMKQYAGKKFNVTKS